MLTPMTICHVLLQMVLNLASTSEYFIKMGVEGKRFQPTALGSELGTLEGTLKTIKDTMERMNKKAYEVYNEAGLMGLFKGIIPTLITDGNRIIKKSIHVRVEHVMPSRCTEEFKQRVKKTTILKAEAKARGEAIASLKRGTCLLKYGRRGKPKFCPFRLSNKKFGNDADTYFWEDLWHGDMVLKQRNPRLYALEVKKTVDVASKLWYWTLDGSGEFSVASARKVIDDNRFPEVSTQIRRIKAVPIKVNIHAWNVRMDCLPTRLNISRRGIDIPSILCPVCGSVTESSSHLFFDCLVAKDNFRKICRWWEVDFMEVHTFDEWVSWIVNLRIPIKHKRYMVECEPGNAIISPLISILFCDDEDAMKIDRMGAYYGNVTKVGCILKPLLSFESCHLLVENVAL
ncbi:RNA-directed DNA polymerase, eukaryota, reverse transcriptase zinc-binding domain protein [Tanacetum coccineum]